jgi:N-hydroxyarylamine O-acetyltransferase
MTPSSDLDLGRYLGRIGYAGDRSPTARVLDAIVAHHVRTIPFENLDPFRGVPNRLELSALQHKLVESGRGGYCFEHNLLLRAALLQLGFEVTALSARVLWGRDPDELSRRSHMLLTVTVDGRPRLVDVGFGGMVVNTTLALEVGTVQPAPLEPFRLLERDGDYVLQAQVLGQWRALYRFDLQRQEPVDYEASNWYLSTWPGSPFITELRGARTTEDRRYALRDRSLAVHQPGRPTKRRTLTSAAELRTVLEEDLHIDTRGLDIEAVYGRL